MKLMQRTPVSFSLVAASLLPMLAVYILITALLTVFNGWLSLSEMAVRSSRRVKLRERVDRHRPGARAALCLAEDPNRFLSRIQVGTTLIGVLVGALLADLLDQ